MLFGVCNSQEAFGGSQRVTSKLARLLNCTLSTLSDLCVYVDLFPNHPIPTYRMTQMAKVVNCSCT